MPLYDYDCAACSRRFEVIHGVFADPPATCPLCGAGPVRKAIAAPTIHFKGSGWAKKERHAASRRSTASTGDEGSGGATDTSDAEPAAKGAAKDAAAPAAGATPTPSTGAKPKAGSEPTPAAAAD